MCNIVVYVFVFVFSDILVKWAIETQGLTSKLFK